MQEAVPIHRPQSNLFTLDNLHLKSFVLKYLDIHA